MLQLSVTCKAMGSDRASKAFLNWDPPSKKQKLRYQRQNHGASNICQSIKLSYVIRNFFHLQE